MAFATDSISPGDALLVFSGAVPTFRRPPYAAKRDESKVFGMTAEVTLMNTTRPVLAAGVFGLLAACSSSYDTCTAILPKDSVPDSVWVHSFAHELSDEQLAACRQALASEERPARLERLLYAVGVRLADEHRVKYFETNTGPAAELYEEILARLWKNLDAVEAGTPPPDELAAAREIYVRSEVLHRHLENSLQFPCVSSAGLKHEDDLAQLRGAARHAPRLYGLHELSHQPGKPVLTAEERDWLVQEAALAEPRIALHTALRYGLSSQEVAAMGERGLALGYDRTLWGATASALYSRAREQDFDGAHVDAALEFMRGYPEDESTIPLSAALRWGVLEHLRHGNDARALELFRVAKDPGWIRPFNARVGGGPDATIRRDAMVCGSYQSLVRLRAVRLSGNPYLAVPKDCVAAPMQVPLQGHQVVGTEFIRGVIEDVGEVWVFRAEVEDVKQLPGWPE